MKTGIFFTLAATVANVLAIPTLMSRQDSCPRDAISCSSNSGGECCTPTNGILLLVQQWVPGYGPDDQFTIHGLWPDTCSGGQTGDNGCDASRLYSNLGSIIQKNGTLYNNMNTYWPSYKNDNPSFWSHEWNKHGTCVSTLQPKCYGDYKQYADVYDYFGKTLQLREQYNLYSALSKAQITPGDSYDAQDMESAIQNAFGVQPQVNCKDGKLNEIWLYFNVKNGNTYIPIDTINGSSCSGSVNYPTK
ncbi:RNase Sy [Cunninghamella echinulata]|nr:RNase Sy [Cunninghamella echinulata]